VSDGNKAIVVDAGYSSEAADNTTAIINDLGVPLVAVFITHAHPDHFAGLDELHSSWPKCKFYVATQNILDELIQTAQTDKVTINSSLITVHTSTTFDILSVPMTIDSDWLPGETEYAAMLYVPSESILFTGDIFGHDINLYLGPTVDLPRVDTWKTNLATLKTRYPQDTNLYPGHGSPTSNTDPVDDDVTYLNAFESIITTCGSTTTTAIVQLKQEFPQYASTDFLLDYLAINPAWNDSSIKNCDAPSSGYSYSSAATLGYSHTHIHYLLLLFVIVLLLVFCQDI